MIFTSHRPLRGSQNPQKPGALRAPKSRFARFYNVFLVLLIPLGPRCGPASFGFALFYLRGVAPETVTTMDIYRGIIPFVIIQVLGLIILAFWPELATWLPKLLFG